MKLLLLPISEVNRTQMLEKLFCFSFDRIRFQLTKLYLDITTMFFGNVTFLRRYRYITVLGSLRHLRLRTLSHGKKSWGGAWSSIVECEEI